MTIISKLKNHSFLFFQLVRRDFNKKYKRTFLGMGWSMISPLANLLIMWLVFNTLLGSSIEHFTIYLFSGQLIYGYFCDTTNQGMTSLTANASIFSKVNVPKYLFTFSQNVSCLINFALTLVIYFLFVGVEGLPFTWKFIMLLFPIALLIFFNLGVSLILSALQVFFRDMQYLWGIMTQLIMWLSAIFYSIEAYSYTAQCLYLLNPIYLFIRYFRKIVIDGVIPTPEFHLLMLADTLIVLGIGMFMYKKYNHEFLYYM